MKIKMVSKQEAADIIMYRVPKGSFFLYEWGRGSEEEISGREASPNDYHLVTGIDNRTGDAWTESFFTLANCLYWLSDSWHKEVSEDELDTQCRFLLKRKRDSTDQLFNAKEVHEVMTLSTHPEETEVELSSISSGKYTQFKIDGNTVLLLDSKDIANIENMIRRYKEKLMNLK